MYRGISPQQSCARAWVAAASAIMENGDEGYNVIIDVTDPITHDEKDNEVISLVDKFLKFHFESPIITVSNTIFPQSLLDAHGPIEFYSIDHRDYDLLTDTKRWGRYFERMTRHYKADGKEYNPLQNMIDKMKRQEVAGVHYKSAYELAVYDPLKDGRSLYGTLPCLSFLSFKLHPIQGLLLTAMYRNHTYISRCLGNLIGLGRLQAFVATQAGVKRGSLTIISTHAELDKKGGQNGWGIEEARDLVNQAASMFKEKRAFVKAGS
jgi:thymidylate synthase